MSASPQFAAVAALEVDEIRNSWIFASKDLCRSYVELFKLRVTTLVVITAWAGFYMGAVKSGAPAFTWMLFHTLLGIGIVSGGAAALNQVLEVASDGLMLRTRMRPLPSGRMGMPHAAMVGLLAVGGGAAYLSITTNLLAGILALLTALGYVGIYTPLKRLTPASTFLGAFPGAMPPLLGWTAARGAVEFEAVVLFAILFFWQFPHFHSIAWLYREDYERAGIKMLPVVAPNGTSTVREVLIYALLLIPVSITPFWLHMGGRLYLFSSLGLGLFLLCYSIGFARLLRNPADNISKKYARELLRASVLYLPLLLIALTIDAPRHG